VTLPAIFLLHRGGARARERIAQVVADRGFSRVSHDEIVRLANQVGALDQARALAEQYAEEAARQDPGGVSSPRPTWTLAALPDFILARDH